MSNARNIAERIADTVNAHGEGLTADYDYDGDAASVAINHGRRIASVTVNSDGSVEWTASNRRGLIKSLIAKAEQTK